MSAALESMVAVAYVRDLRQSSVFYELLGFEVHSSGRGESSAWSALHNGTSQIVLTSTRPQIGVPELPLLFYFFFDDVDAVVHRVQSAGVAADHMGFPPHAPGGEVRLTDPDGNTVLIGQRERSGSLPTLSQEESKSRFSLLREAAAAVAARGGAEVHCEVSDPAGAPCARRADVKLADSGGDSAWACLDHADEILVTVRGAYVVTYEGPGIAQHLAFRSGRSGR